MQNPDPAPSVAGELLLPAPPQGVRPSVAAAASFFPTVGAFVGFWNGHLQNRREADVQRFSEAVIASINALESQQKNSIDAEHFWSEDFARTFVAASEMVSRSPDESKRRYLQHFVTNYALVERPDITLKDIYWSIIADLTGLHLVLLDALYSRQASVGVTGLRTLRNDSTRSELISRRFVAANVLKCNDLTCTCISTTLEQRALVQTMAGPKGHADSSERILLTELGYDFTSFVLGEVACSA